MSASVMSSGSVPPSAASISPRSSRSSGSMYASPSARKRSASLSTGGAFFTFAPSARSVYSFRLHPRSSARPRTRMLCATLPVK